MADALPHIDSRGLHFDDYQPFNGTMHVCQRVIDYMIQAEQTRAVQKFMKKSEIILPPPPACLSNVADATEGLTDA